MWRLLHKSVLAIDPLVRISIAVSVGVHFLIILFCVVMQFVKPAHHIIINKDALSTKNITIIIDPHAPITGVVVHNKSKNVAGAPTKAQPKNNAPAKVATTVVAEKKSVKQNLVKKKSPQKAKKQSAKVAKKPVTKKTAPKPKPAAKKTVKPDKKDVPKKIEKLEPKKVIEPIMPEPEPQPVEAPITQQPVSDSPAMSPLAAEIVGPILIARSASDAAALTVQLAIQEELLRVWHPPVGIEDGISCVVLVVLDGNGIVQEIEIKKPSGLLLFDVSARAAIQQAVWPRAVWGTTLELCLQ